MAGCSMSAASLCALLVLSSASSHHHPPPLKSSLPLLALSVSFWSSPSAVLVVGVPGKTPGDAATRLVRMPRPYSDLVCTNVVTSVSCRKKDKKRTSVTVIALLYTERRKRARRRNRGRRCNRNRDSYCTQYVTI